jgi:phosphoribosylanthranilate isomerase
MHLPPRVKVCCIASVEEARLAAQAGADVLGLVSAMPSGPGPIPESDIAEIADALRGHRETWLLTCLRSPAEIADQWRRCRTSGVQLTDSVEGGGVRELRRLLPATVLIQVIHVTGPESVAESLAAAEWADVLLLDSGNPSLTVKELGGTGRVHDWSVSAEIVRRSPRPVFLAGGLRGSNAAEALRAVAPTGLDLCSGVRTDGRLDPAKLADFMHAVRGGAR